MAFVVPDEIEQYIHQHTASLGELFDTLAEETRETLPLPQMQVGRVEGQLLRMLIQLSGTSRVLEIGTYSGYSALAMASALPAEGHLVTCDIDPVATRVAQRYFDKAAWGSKIELRLGPALDTMRELVREERRFDLVFIDADKTNYVNYFNAAMDLIPVGGLIVVDNALWSGTVLAPNSDDATAIAQLNKTLASDPRVEQVLLSVRDGIHLARKVR
jgi:caffeoyl-CoA O-methyltransferase